MDKHTPLLFKLLLRYKSLCTCISFLQFISSNELYLLLTAKELQTLIHIHLQFPIHSLCCILKRKSP